MGQKAIIRHLGRTSKLTPGVQPNTAPGKIDTLGFRQSRQVTLSAIAPRLLRYTLMSAALPSMNMPRHLPPHAAPQQRSLGAGACFLEPKEAG